MDSNGSSLAAHVAAQLRRGCDELASHWLEHTVARATQTHGRLDRIDQLTPVVHRIINDIADFISDADDHAASGATVAGVAGEIAMLRFAAGIDAETVLEDVGRLGGALYEFTVRIIEESTTQYAAREIFYCTDRLFRAILLVERSVASQYVRRTLERSRQREERLRRFNRMISHELKGRVSAALGAGQLLQEEWLDSGSRVRFANIVTENARSIQNLLENLITLSTTDESRRRVRRRPLSAVVDEVVRQQRDSARARGVEIRVQPDLPVIDVNAAAVELCLSNYLSNAIKYSDPARADRWIEISAAIADTVQNDTELILRVRDNGVGVPHSARPRLFERFYRAYMDAARIEGTGLGLNLVLETVESLGGRAWAEFSEEPGSTFAFALPCRRADEPALEAGTQAQRTTRTRRRYRSSVERPPRQSL